MEKPSPKSQKQRGARWKAHFLERLKTQHKIDATYLLQWLETNSKLWALEPDASPLGHAMEHEALHRCRRATPGDRECAAYRGLRILAARIDFDHQNPERTAILKGALKRRRALIRIRTEFARMLDDVPWDEQLRRWRKRNTVPVLFTSEFSDALFKGTMGVTATLMAVDRLVALAPDLEGEFRPGAKPRRLLARAEKALRIGGFDAAMIVEMLKDGGKAGSAKKRMNDRIEGLRDSEEIGD